MFSFFIYAYTCNRTVDLSPFNANYLCDHFLFPPDFISVCYAMLSLVSTMYSKDGERVFICINFYEVRRTKYDEQIHSVKYK